MSPVLPLLMPASSYVSLWQRLSYLKKKKERVSFGFLGSDVSLWAPLSFLILACHPPLWGMRSRCKECSAQSEAFVPLLLSAAAAERSTWGRGSLQNNSSPLFTPRPRESRLCSLVRTCVRSWTAKATRGPLSKVNKPIWMLVYFGHAFKLLSKVNNWMLIVNNLIISWLIIDWSVAILLENLKFLRKCLRKT